MGRIRVALLHASSVVGIGIWATALVGLLGRPGVEADMLHHGWRAWLVVATLGLFVLIVLLVQGYMGLPASAVKFATPRKLMVEGPFRLTRNPIYLSVLLPLAGFSGYSLHVAVAAVVVYLFAMTKWVIIPEERQLAEVFGDTYTRYAARTPRWLFI